MVLIHRDPLRELDRFARQVLDTAAHPAVMPMDAWRKGAQFIVEFDPSGINLDSLDLKVEHKELTVRAERPDVDHSHEMPTAAERSRGVFSRQLLLGGHLDTDKVDASYHDGVLRLTIPVAEPAKPRHIEISRSGQKEAVKC